MITVNVLRRVFQILHDESTATAFALDVDNRQYLVTARHAIEGLSSSDEIQILHDNQWKNIQVQPIWCANEKVDIAVLAINQQLSPPTLPLEASANKIMAGQDMYFLGFPYGWSTDHGYIFDKFPMPFIKKAILSAIGVDAEKIVTFYLDGHNNRGFSGAPIVYKMPNSTKLEYKVAGVISGFAPQDEPIYDKGKKTTMTYEYNTGIIAGYDVKYALEAIRQNPIGFPLP